MKNNSSINPTVIVLSNLNACIWLTYAITKMALSMVIPYIVQLFLMVLCAIASQANSGRIRRTSLFMALPLLVVLCQEKLAGLWKRDSSK